MIDKTPNLLDIIGNIKVDESNPDRIKHLLCCIHSFAFLKDDVTFILNLESPSFRLYNVVEKALSQIGFRYHLTLSLNENYGQKYLSLMKRSQSRYILNFIEDAFCLIDDKKTMNHLLYDMYFADVMRACFWKIEHNSIHPDIKKSISPEGSVLFLNDAQNFELFQRYYGSRYYVGVNFITSRSFAEKFWNQDKQGIRPHEYEISGYTPHFAHQCLIPGVEVLASIDDPHGEDGTHLLARKDEKFVRIYNEVTV